MDEKEKEKETTLPNTVTRRENFDFDLIFSKEELASKSQQLARACKERNSLEDDKKSAMSSYKSRIDSKSAEINLLTEDISSGKQFVSKTCDALLDYDKGIKTYFHDGGPVGEVKLSKSDYQLRASDLEKTFDEKVEIVVAETLEENKADITKKVKEQLKKPESNKNFDKEGREVVETELDKQA